MGNKRRVHVRMDPDLRTWRADVEVGAGIVFEAEFRGIHEDLDKAEVVRRATDAANAMGIDLVVDDR